MVDADVVAEVRSSLLRDGQSPTRAAIAQLLAGRADVLGPTMLEQAVVAVHRELVGAGPLQPLLDDPAVTDVLVNGPAEVWIDRGAGLERANVQLGSSAALRDLAVRLAAAAGQRLDDACPTVDGQLPDGTRLHAVIAPLVESAAVLSLRVPRVMSLSVADLVTSGTVTPSWQGVIEAIVRHRLSVLVSGSTGSGKTTVLSALLGLVPADERIVLVEEARELRPAHPHVVALTARRANVEGSGTVGLDTLVRESLRMRPDRIVLGECRGVEIRDLLLALNTGHDGSCTTLHANGASEVPARLVALGMLAGIPAQVVAQQAAAALDVIVHVRRARSAGGDVRRISEIGVLTRTADGGLVVEPALVWDGIGPPGTGPAWAGLAGRLGLASRRVEQ